MLEWLARSNYSNNQAIRQSSNPEKCVIVHNKSCIVALSCKPKKQNTMAYKIVDIEGIGEVYAAKLNAAGVKNTDDLLKNCATRTGRRKMAEATGISEKLILKWTNHADLPANLYAKMEAVNAEKNLVNRVPSVKEIEKMVAQAKVMEPMVKY